MSTPIYYYYAVNSRGDVVGIYTASGSLLVVYEYDAWGNILSVKNANGVNIANPNSIANIQSLRYRGYCYDTDSGLYYLQSRYYDPVTHRFINADKVLDPRSVISFNLFQYCSNNPVNLSDASGEFFFGALIGGIVGGAVGALTALATGKSVTAGFVTGAATGAAIGLVCDCVATGGISAAIGVAACGIIAGVGNICNQYWNYRIERINTTKNNYNSYSYNNQSNDGTYYDSNDSYYNGEGANRYSSFGEYLDVGSVITSSLVAMTFAPLAIGSNCVVNSAFVGCDTSGIIGFVAQFGANFALGGNASLLQASIEIFITET